MLDALLVGEGNWLFAGPVAPARLRGSRGDTFQVLRGSAWCMHAASPLLAADAPAPPFEPEEVLTLSAAVARAATLGTQDVRISLLCEVRSVAAEQTSVSGTGSGTGTVVGFVVSDPGASLGGETRTLRTQAQCHVRFAAEIVGPRLAEAATRLVLLFRHILLGASGPSLDSVTDIAWVQGEQGPAEVTAGLQGGALSTVEVTDGTGAPVTRHLTLLAAAAMGGGQGAT
jgi:hypothetical protein